MTKSVHSPVVGLLGLAVRAGQVRGGTEAVKQSIRNGKSRLVILAEDASEGTKRSFRKLAGSRGVPVLECHTSLELGTCLNRAPKVVLSISDRHFASGMLKKAGPADDRTGLDGTRAGQAGSERNERGGTELKRKRPGWAGASGTNRGNH